jgi:AsmA protein
MKRVLLIAGGVVFLLLAAIVAIPFLIPASQYKAQIEASASQAVGREFKINGPIRFAFWPTLGVTADDVTIANARGGKAPFFASIGELDIGVKPMPLLSGDIQIERLVLRKPALALEEDAGGKPNWIFDTPAQPDQKQKPTELKSLGLDDIRIEDGALTYSDKLGKTTAISALGAQAKLESLDAPFTLASDFIYNADKTSLKIALQSPRAMLKQARSPLRLDIDAPKLGVNFDGMIDFKDFSLDGKFDAKGPSLRQLCAWSGNPIGEGGGFGGFYAAGGFKMAGPRIDIAHASFALDAAKGAGHIAITMDPTGKPPYVSGTVALDSLDVNPYLGPPPAAGAAPAGVNVGAPWGNGPLDMSGLKAINADLNLTTGPLLFQKMKLDSSAIDVALKDGVMTAALNKLVFYGGTGTGVLIIDGRNPGMRLGNKLAARGVSAEPFLTDAIGFNKVQGKANIDLDIKGLGTTQQGLMNTLGGTGKFSFQDGALKGVNLAQVARQVQSVLSGAAVGESAKTDFAEMAASFTILNGVATTKDGRMLNPFIRVTSAGDLDIARQQINMKVTPTVVKAAEGQGGALDLKGLTVPFIVKGPWSKLSFAPALGDVFQNKAQSEIGKVLEKNNLGGILGGKSADGKTTNPLSNLFGKKQ